MDQKWPGESVKFMSIAQIEEIKQNSLHQKGIKHTPNIAEIIELLRGNSTVQQVVKMLGGITIDNPFIPHAVRRHLLEDKEGSPG